MDIEEPRRRRDAHVAGELVSSEGEEHAVDIDVVY